MILIDCKNIPEMPPKCWERNLIQNWRSPCINFNKEVRKKQTDRCIKDFGIIFKDSGTIQGMCLKIFRKISVPELELSLYWHNFSKKLSQLTDWQTYMKFRIIWNFYTDIPGKPPKISERYLLQIWRHSYMSLILVRK